MNDTDYDWFRFWVHFVCGAAVGAVIGGVFWLQSGHGDGIALLLLTGFSLGVALTGGIYGDRFWEQFLKCLTWLRWW